MTEPHDNLVQAEILAETATIQWRELQYFFAAGKAIYVSTDIDLIDVATQIARDDKTAVAKWMQESQLAPVSDEQAKQWYDNDAIVWAVVVKPWVLVQEKK